MAYVCLVMFVTSLIVHLENGDNMEKEFDEYFASVITISDKGSKGERMDTAGPAVSEILKKNNIKVSHTEIISDDIDRIAGTLKKLADSGQYQLIITTGGTGFSPRDNTPEATKIIIEKECPGISEYMRAECVRITPRSALSRGVSGIRNRTLIINLPGSEKAARENLTAILPILDHALQMVSKVIEHN